MAYLNALVQLFVEHSRRISPLLGLTQFPNEATGSIHEDNG